MVRRSKHSILLVEDNPADVGLMQEAFEACNAKTALSTAMDGAEAISMLDRHLQMEDKLPSLIILDLNLPKVSGFEVLAYVKRHHLLKTIPVIILSTSSSEEDIRRCYEENSNCYLTKPLDLDQFLEMAAGIYNFWFRMVRLPESPFLPN